MKPFLFLAVCLCILVSTNADAQYGVIDNTFNPLDLGPNASSGPGGVVYNSVKQSDDKILIGGNFNMFYGTTVNGLCRLQEDGTIDPSFLHTVEAIYTSSPKINRIILLPNGQLLIGGIFNIGSCVHLARLNTDGSLDPSFNNDTIFNGEVTNLDVLQDGRIVVTGNFSQCYNQSRNGIAILNADGTLDNTFVPNTPAGCTIKGLCLTQDNKILIGKPSSFGNAIVQKLDLTGQVDPAFSFTQGFGVSVWVNAIRELPNGKILVAGYLPLNTYSQTGINGLLRINANGSSDPGFYTYSSGTPGEAREIFDFQTLADSSIIIGGKSSNYYQFARLNSLGVEQSFFQRPSYSTSTFSRIHSVSLLSDSTVLVGGSFSIQNEFRNGLMKFNLNGSFIEEFMPYYGANKPIRRVQKTSNGQLMISGDFSIYNGYIADQFARINEDGSIDTTFHGVSDDPSSLDVTSFVTQSTGKVIAKYNNSSLRRYNADGSLDASFNVPLTAPADFKMVVDNSDNIYYYSNSSINKLLPDGTVDPSFNEFYASGCKNFIVLSTGKIIVAGTFNVIKRLNQNGTVDNSFVMDPGLTLDSYHPFYGFQVYEDVNGKILCGNAFQMNGFMNFAPNMFFRLNQDGSFDTSFKPAYPMIDVVGILSDTTIMALVQVPNETQQQIVWLKNTGEIDYRFPQKEFQYVNFRASSLLLSDEKCILAGYIYSYDGHAKNNILAFTNCFGPVSYDHVTAYNHFTWMNGVDYTESTTGEQYAFPNSSACDSIVILDLNIINPEINVFTTPSSDTACNGTAYVSMTGIGPFTFLFQGGWDIENATHTYSNLCPGVYDISVVDNLGLTFTSTFVVAEESAYFFDPFPPGTVVSDSISVVVENCSIDYNTVYDAYIDSFAVVGQDSVLVYWAIVDSLNTTIIEAIYYFPDTLGNYYIQLELFCPEKSTPHFLVATQGVRYKDGKLSTLNVSDNELKNLTLYPNPTNDHVRISFSGSDAELTVYDLQGKVVLKDSIQNHETISLENFERGVYLFDLKNSQGQSVKRVVKQ